MTKYTSYAENVDRWGKGRGFLVGELQHLPPMPLAGTPLSFLGGIILHKQPQGLGGCTKTPLWHCLSAGLGREHQEG